MTDVRKSAERLAAHLIIAFLVIAVLYFTLPLAWRYFSPFIIALPCASMIQPLTNFFEHRLKLKHSIAVTMPLIVLFLILAVAMFWLVTFGFNQFSYLLTHYEEVFSESSSLITRSFNRIIAQFKGLSDENVTLVRSLLNNALVWLSTQISTWAGSAVNMTVNWATSIPYLFLYLNFLVFGIYFIAKDYDRLMEHYHRGLLGNPDTSTGKITNSAVVGLMGWLRCQAIYALLSLIAGSIYWTAFGYRYGILISVGAAILEFLPIVGNGTVYIPWAIIALLVGRPRSTILSLALYFGLLLIRRVTEPKILSNNIGVSPLLSLMSMFAGLKFGGILGMICSTMIAAVITTLWEGEFRRTIMYDAHVVFLFLAERWDGISAPHSSEPKPDRPPDEKPRSSRKAFTRKNKS